MQIVQTSYRTGHSSQRTVRALACLYGVLAPNNGSRLRLGLNVPTAAEMTRDDSLSPSGYEHSDEVTDW
jgi:hypothetical protein